MSRATATSALDDPILKVRDLSIDIPLSGSVLSAGKGISYDVYRGETFAIVGESGSGKSISALSLLGIQTRKANVSASTFTFDGKDLLEFSPREFSKIRGRDIAMIFQDPMTALNPVYTIGQQLTEVFLRHKQGTRSQAKARALSLLGRVGIPNAAARLAQYPHQLSGGLRQRVVIAMALMCSPKLIVADEPTTALDVTVQAMILQILKELQREFGMAMILITHDLGVVASVADRMAVMYAGEIVETGTVQQVFRRPTHPYTQGLLKCVPGHGIRPGSSLATIPGIVPSLIDRTPGCEFRNRCPLAVDRCQHHDIALREIADGHHCRCLHEPDMLLAHFRKDIAA